MSENLQNTLLPARAAASIGNRPCFAMCGSSAWNPKNRPAYLPETLRRAIPLYEGAKVNVNHPAGSPTSPRSYADRIGTIRNVTADGGGLRGDLHANPKHAIAEQLMWDAEHAPDAVGLSHNVEARTSRRDGKTIVEEIVRVQSVDLVADPASTRGLFEGHDSQAEKWQLVENVAAEIGLPRWAIPPLDTGLAYRETREEIRAYLMTIQEVLRSNGTLPAAVTDGKSFARAVTGRPRPKAAKCSTKHWVFQHAARKRKTPAKLLQGKSRDENDRM